MAASEQEKPLQLLKNEYHWIYGYTSLFCSWRWEQYHLLHGIFAVFPNSTKLQLILNFLCCPRCLWASTFSYDRCSKVGVYRVLYVREFVFWPLVWASIDKQAFWNGRGGVGDIFSLGLGMATSVPPQQSSLVFPLWLTATSLTETLIPNISYVRFNTLTLPHNHPVAWDIR